MRTYLYCDRCIEIDLDSIDPLFYDVATRLSELHLDEVGIDVAWRDVDVSDDTVRWGKTREYFSLPIYKLPIGRMKRL